MIDACKDLKLDAALGDTLAYLQKVPPDSLIGLTAFQVVEHVPVVDELSEREERSLERFAALAGDVDGLDDTVAVAPRRDLDDFQRSSWPGGPVGLL